MPKHARPRPSAAEIVTRSSRTLVIAAVSGGVLVSSSAAADAHPRTESTANEHAITHAERAAAVRAAEAHEGVARARAYTAWTDRASAEGRYEQAQIAKAEAAKAAAKKLAAARAAAAAKKAALARAKAEAAAKAAAARRARAARSAERAALPSSFGQRVLAVAARYAGTPYVYGGTTPSGFDCSGYVGYVFRQLGVSLPRTAAQQYAATQRISASQVRPGDLVFVHSSGGVSHVAIYAGNGYWWEASRPGKPVGKHKAWTTSISYGRVSA